MIRSLFSLCAALYTLSMLTSITMMEKHYIVQSTSFVDFPEELIVATAPRHNLTLSALTSTSPEHQYHRPELCFVTSVFASDLDSADRVGSVTQHQLREPSFHFLLFTNLEELPAPGWTKIVETNLSERFQINRTITQSRWAKFLPWQHPMAAQCPVIFYLDGYTLPVNTERASEKFREAATLIRANDFGLGQYPKRGSRIRKLAKGLGAEGKDTPENVQITMDWLQAQPDFNSKCTLYINRHIGIDPQNRNYQRLSQYFWDVYAQEQGSWRDQLLWCHVVSKFHANPVNLHAEIAPMKVLFEEHREFMGYNAHTYVSPVSQ